MLFTVALSTGNTPCCYIEMSYSDPPDFEQWMQRYTTKDEQNNKSHLLFSFLVRYVLVLHINRIYFQTYDNIILNGFITIITTFVKIND